MQENYKILVVDDDARLRALLERYLSEQGFQVRSVANGEQMDRLLTRENFHLMVLISCYRAKMACRFAVVCVTPTTCCLF